MTEFVDIVASDKDDFMDMCIKFHSSEAVLMQTPHSNYEKLMQDTLAGSPFLRIIMIKKDGKNIGYCQLSFTYSAEAGGQVVLVEEFYLYDEYRCGGIGTQFFGWLYSQYDDKIKRYRLELAEANIRVMGLYNKVGFKKLDYIQMIRDI